jgi:cystathionine beta-lyase/cystathionine gamma-synthase
MHIRTVAVHAGSRSEDAHGSVATPIYQTSIFTFVDPETPRDYDYTRSGNPTRSALAENIAALENGVGAVCCATGMGAETLVLMTLNAGDHVIAPDDLYGGSHRLLAEVMRKKWKLDVSFVRMTDLDAVRAAVRPNTRLLWIETPSNPLLRIFDIRALVDLANEHAIRTLCDNTFASPCFQRPLDLGCDLVLHSTTKYLNGHSDVVGGAVVASRPDLLEELEYHNNALGIAQAPFDAWLVLRGIKTLPLRMEAHQATAIQVARFLEAHPKVKRVYFPGLESHVGHALAKRQMRGFPGMVSFEVETGRAARILASGVTLFKLTESLGGTTSLLELPYHMSHASMPEEARVACGITDGLIRLSLGLEHPDDLVGDLEDALSRL